MRHLFLYVAVCSLILCESACSKSNSSPQTQTPKQAIVTTFAGNGSGGLADGTGTSAQFNHPYGVVIDGSGNLYISDDGNNRIRQVTPSGTVNTIAGGVEGYVDGTGTATDFFYPTNLSADKSGNLFVSDTYNQRIRKITSAGVVTTFAGGGTTGPGAGSLADGTGSPARFQGPAGLVFDGSGNLYVADNANNLIRKITFK